MNVTLWLLVAAVGGWIAVASPGLGAESYQARGAPYAFGSERAFCLSYRLLGLALTAASGLVLLLGFDLNALGLAFLALGTELCLRSRHLGLSFWEDARRHPDLYKYQRGVFITGIGSIVMGLLALIHKGLLALFHG